MNVLVVEPGLLPYEKEINGLRYSGRAKLTFKCREFAATPSRKR